MTHLPAGETSHIPTAEQQAIIDWQGQRLVVRACRHRKNGHSGCLCAGPA